MKRCFTLILLAALLAFGLCLSAQAEFYAKVYNADMVNIRSGPGSDYPWLTSIPRDGQVRVTGEYGGWYQVTTLDGAVSGYMYKDYLTPVTSGYSGSYYGGDVYIPRESTYGIVADTDSLNLRSGPGTEYAWLGSAGRGEWIEILGETGNWYEVRVVTSGQSGYMSKNFIQVWYAGSGSYGGNTAVVQNPAGTRFLNLRAYPSYEADVLDIFYNGETCTILDKRSDGWWYVTADRGGVTLTGYFRSEYLSLTGSGETTTVNTNKNGGNGRSLNLRDRPSVISSNILRQIPNGSTVSVYLKGSVMWQVAYDGTVGFVDSGFLGRDGGGYVPGYQPYQPVTGNAYVRTGNSGRLNLRAQANTNSRVLGRYDNGTPVTILQQGTGWCYVQVDGQTGYMMTKYLSVGSVATTKQVVNNNGGTYVNLRTTPQKTSGNVNVRVPVGSTVTLLSWGQEWSQVTYGSYSGYMMSWFLK